MTTINLKDFYYWYTQDQFIEVTEEVAGALRASIRYEAAYSELAARINSAPLKKSKSKRLEDAIAAKEKELAKIMRYKCYRLTQNNPNISLILSLPRLILCSAYFHHFVPIFSFFLINPINQS